MDEYFIEFNKCYYYGIFLGIVNLVVCGIDVYDFCFDDIFIIDYYWLLLNVNLFIKRLRVFLWYVMFIKIKLNWFIWSLVYFD